MQTKIIETRAAKWTGKTNVVLQQTQKLPETLKVGWPECNIQNPQSE